MEFYNKVELKSLDFYTEEHDGVKTYLAKAVYECKNQYRKTEVIIPRIMLPVDSHHIPAIRREEAQWLYTPGWFIDIFGSEIPLRPDEDGNVYYEKVIEEYPQKMTLAEIEKKLGYKVELVSEK